MDRILLRRLWIRLEKVEIHVSFASTGTTDEWIHEGQELVGKDTGCVVHLDRILFRCLEDTFERR